MVEGWLGCRAKAGLGEVGIARCARLGLTLTRFFTAHGGASAVAAAKAAALWQLSKSIPTHGRGDTQKYGPNPVSIKMSKHNLLISPNRPLPLV